MKMLFVFCCIFLCYDFAMFFPQDNCNAQNKIVLAILHCNGEIEEQINFIREFTEYMKRNTQKNSDIQYNFAMMIGDRCSKNINLYLDQEFKYNETLPISSVLEYIRQRQDKIMQDCAIMSLSFIFVFNYEKYPIDTMEFYKMIEVNREYLFFFIFQTSRKHSFKKKDYIHFTTSFKVLSLEDIFNKICDMSVDKFTLSYSGSGYIKSEYRINNELTLKSPKAHLCDCRYDHGMELLSLETYEEFVDITQHIKNVLQPSTDKVNLLLVFFYTDERYVWTSGNPYTFYYPSRMFNGMNCFDLNLSNYTDTILFQDKNMYKLGEYMEEINCDGLQRHHFLICEQRVSSIPKIYYEQLNKQISTNINSVELSYNHMYDSFHKLYALVSTSECKEIEQENSQEFKVDLCSNYVKTNMSIDINNVQNNYISLVNYDYDDLYTLSKVNVSKCKMYNKCQNMSHNGTDYELTNRNVDIFCADDEINNSLNKTCSINTVNLGYTLERVQCESNKHEYALKCIIIMDSKCEDNSNLKNCENFSCPDSFIKCINSYCIFPEMLRNNVFDCPHGEDEILLSEVMATKALCQGYFILEIQDLCFNIESTHILPNAIFKSSFQCANFCPNHYKCISSKILEYSSNKNYFETKTKINQMHIRAPLKLKSILISNQYNDLLNSFFFSIVSFKGQNCSLTNFDTELRYWEFKDLTILDVSYNSIDHCSFLKSVQHFSKLKLLNLSHNENLIIDQSFNFPISLEIIDLSYTKLKALRNLIFVDLKNLKHLNISQTLITQFKDMGLPAYFKLDSFYIQHLKFQHIEKNVFRGLTINSALVASDFVFCCPQILNENISVDKCHAPVDFISSCKHLVGDTFKRIVIWIVGLVSIVGNVIVLIYRIGWNREIFQKAYGHFITGLAFSDLLMGFYLIILASEDAYYKDNYVIDDFKWRHSFICSFCGCLSTLSCEASTFFVCLITVDRFLCITYPFGEHRFSNTGRLISITLVWFFGFVTALIPVILSDMEIYSSNGLCLALPLSPTQNKGWIFSFFVFVCLNFLLFLFIAFGQITIFTNFVKVKKSISSITQNNPRKSEELTVAIKLAVVAFTNFCSWFPIGILGFFSLNGYIFNREVYAWVAVFVLPINSALNPIVYTIPDVYNKCKTYINKNSLRF